MTGPVARRRIEVLISGAGHHDRTARAQPVVAAIVALGLDVVVRTDLRPRLADDIRSLLIAGATSVRLVADGMVGDFVGQPADGGGDLGVNDGESLDVTDEMRPGAVVVVLRAGQLVEPRVRGEGGEADRVRAALAALDTTDGDAG